MDVSIGYPPDTDTPGYETEEQSKPEICRKVNAALGSELFPSDKASPETRVVCRGLHCSVQPNPYVSPPITHPTPAKLVWPGQPA